MWSGFAKSCLRGSRKRPSDETSQSGSDAETLTGAPAAQAQTHELQLATPAAAGATPAGSRPPCPPGHIEAPTPTSTSQQPGSSQTSAGSSTKEKKGRGSNLPSASTHDDPANRILISPTLTGAIKVEIPTEKIKKSSDVSQEITTIMKGRYKVRGPWASYNDMLRQPPPGYDPDTDTARLTRFPAHGDGESSWLEFQRKFTWLPAHHDRIQNIYQEKARLNFNNMLNHAKTKRQEELAKGETPKVPKWMGLGWARMCAYWDDPEVIAKCAKASQNRLQGPRMTHGQGSICQQDVRAKMREEGGGEEPKEIHVMSRTKSRKGGALDEEWRPVIDEITEKTIEVHGPEEQNWPTQPTKETHPPPTTRHRLVGHSGEAPELYGIQSHKKAYVPHAVNVTHYTQAPAQPSAEQLAQQEFQTDLMYSMLAQFPNYKENYTRLYQLRFNRLPDRIPGLDEPGPSNAAPADDENAANRFAEEVLNNPDGTPNLGRDNDNNE